MAFCPALCAIWIILELKAIDLLESSFMFCIFNPIGRIKQKDLSAKHRTFYITNWTVLKSVTIKKESALIAAVLHLCSLKINKPFLQRLLLKPSQPCSCLKFFSPILPLEH